MVERYWGIYVHGIHFRVSNEVVIDIQTDIMAAEGTPMGVPVMMEYKDIFGGAIILDIFAISSMYLSTPELRQSEAAHIKALEAEGQFQ